VCCLTVLITILVTCYLFRSDRFIPMFSNTKFWVNNKQRWRATPMIVKYVLLIVVIIGSVSVFLAYIRLAKMIFRRQVKKRDRKLTGICNLCKPATTAISGRRLISVSIYMSVIRQRYENWTNKKIVNAHVMMLAAKVLNRSSLSFRFRSPISERR